MQLAFCSVDYCFSWTDTWYTWDEKEARKQAYAARNAKAKSLRDEGKTVVKWSNRDQLVRRGGIGTGHPEIDLFCNVFMLDVM